MPFARPSARTGAPSRRFPIRALIERHPGLDVTRIDDVILGCANQAGEDNRNVARMALLLAGLPASVGGATVNRLCGSGMDAISVAARAIVAGEQELIVAGGVESMSRAPFAMPKAATPFSRKAEIFDTTIGWRFVNELMHKQYGTDSMPETAENVAEEFRVSRDDQDRFAAWSQGKTAAAQEKGLFADELTPVIMLRAKQDPLTVGRDEHPRPGTTFDKLSKLPALFRKNGTVTAGNSSGINDGACAVLVASEAAARAHGLTPRARVVGTATAGVPPRIMGIGPVPATRALLARTGLTLDQMDVIEFNEAFAAQALAVTRELGLADDDPRVNPNGGAIAIGHPLAATGLRMLTDLMYEMQRRGVRYGCTSACIGGGQGAAMVIRDTEKS